ARLTGQRALGICPSLPPEPWDYSRVLAACLVAMPLHIYHVLRKMITGPLTVVDQ
ncbi:hypothetical protein STEG23_021615, partial [Scotinomys teguina]